jgi:GTP-binding protein YchF
VKVGIVGLPNAGKSTLFNALTRAGAATAEYPFTTIDPNVAVVPVPDERLAAVARTVGSTRLVPETIRFHDVAGLVRGASGGEGLGNRFLGAIRETDAICHVVRCHEAPGVAHPEGRVDPVADAELVEAELLAADLEQAIGRRERVTRQARSADREAIAERAWLDDVVEALGAGRPVREVPVPEAAAGAPQRLQALTAKPVLYVANVAEGVAEPPPDLLAHAEARGAIALAISTLIEAELAELDEGGEAAELRAELGVPEAGLDRVIAASRRLCQLVTFFTATEGTDATARALRRGETSWHAAGKVHTDIQARFVRAEVVGWRELVDAGGYAAARERGVLRIEGRDYVVAEGDVITIRF